MSSWNGWNSKRIFVLAGNWNEYANWCDSHKLLLSQVTPVTIDDVDAEGKAYLDRLFEYWKQ